MERRRLERELRKAAAAHKRRDELMVEAARSGWTLREIGEVVGLTFGRVGQIVRRDSH